MPDDRILRGPAPCPCEHAVRAFLPRLVGGLARCDMCGMEFMRPRQNDLDEADRRRREALRDALQQQRQLNALYNLFLDTAAMTNLLPFWPAPDVVVPDNATAELVELARAGKRAEFDVLAACLMPREQIATCWAGTRVRLGFGD